jgi:hypothetical protein
MVQFRSVQENLLMTHYHVVQIQFDSVRTLFRTADRDRADLSLDRLSAKFPHAFFDIVEIERPQPAD